MIIIVRNDNNSKNNDHSCTVVLMIIVIKAIIKQWYESQCNTKSHYSNNIESTIAIMINTIPKGSPATQSTCFFIFVSPFQKKSRKTMVISFHNNSNLEVTVGVFYRVAFPLKKPAGHPGETLRFHKKKARQWPVFEGQLLETRPFHSIQTKGPHFFRFQGWLLIPSSWFKGGTNNGLFFFDLKEGSLQWFIIIPYIIG